MIRMQTSLVRAVAALVALGGAAALMAQVKPADAAKLKAATQQQTLLFTENKGQWEPEARFLIRSPGLNYWVTNSGVVMDAYRLKDGEQGQVRDGHVVRMSFSGSGQNAFAEGQGQKGHLSDYLFTDEKGREHFGRGVRGFQEATIRSVYPGIDFRNYIDAGMPRYDLVVKPGADPQQIRMHFSGQKGLRVDPKGDLIIETGIGDLRHAGLHAYQMINGRKLTVAAQFTQTSASSFRFRVGEYNRSYPLIIDPLVYGTHFGGDPQGLEPGYDDVRALASDSANNIYFTGITLCPRFPITEGFYGNLSVQGTDSYLVRMTGDSYAVSYAAYVGGPGVDTGWALGFNVQQNKLWMAGTTTSATLPGTGGGLFNGKQGNTDFFLFRFDINPLGTVTPEYTSFYGAAGATLKFAGMKVSQLTGQVVLAGETNVTGLPNMSNAFFGGGPDAFMTIINPAGTAVDFGKYIGGNGNDRVGGLDVDVSGNIYVTGMIEFVGNQDTATNGNPRFVTTPGVFTNGRLLRGFDAFIQKFDSAGVLKFSALLGGSGDDFASPAVGDPIQGTPPLSSVARLAVDLNGDIYMTGLSRSFNYPRTPNTFGETFNNSSVVVLTKISSDGSQIVYSTHLRTTGRVYPNSIGVDSRGITTIVGIVSFDLPPLPGPTTPGSIVTTGNALDDEYNEGDRQYPPPPFTMPSTYDGFITIMNANASAQLYSSYIGEDANEECWSTFIDFASSAWPVGYSVFAPFQIGTVGIGANYLSQNALKRTPDGGGDGFLVKLRVGLPIIQAVTLSRTNMPGGLGATATATVTLRDPAPIGGVTIVMNTEQPQYASFDPNIELAQTTITIPEGQTTGTQTIWSRSVTVPRTSKIRATLEGDFKEQLLTISPWLSDFTVTPASVPGGNSITARIRLFDLAPPGGVNVSITASAPQVITFPSTVNVPAGQDTAVFTVVTKGVTIPTIEKLTAFLLSVPKTAVFSINPAKLRPVMTFNPDRVNGGTTSMARITLDGVAGAPIDVNITQLDGMAGTFPALVTIPKDATFVDFPVVPNGTTTDNFMTLRGTRGIETSTGTLYVSGNDIAVVEFDSDNILGGNQVKGRVKLLQPAQPGGMTIDVTIGNTFVGTIDKAVLTIPAGQTTSDDFTISTVLLSENRTITVTASKAGFTTIQGILNVRKLDYTFTVNKLEVIGGSENVTGTLTFSEAVPTNGVTITLWSSNTSACTVPATLQVPGNATSAQFTITTHAVQQETPCTIFTRMDTLPEWTTRALTLTITSLGVGIQVSPSSVKGGTGSQGIVTISQPAGPGGVVLNLSSSNTAAAQVPGTVTVPFGQTQAVFNVTTSPVATDTPVTIGATLPSGKSGSAVLTVLAPRVNSLTLNPSSVQGGDPSTGTIVIDGPAPVGGLPVAVTTNRTDVTNVPSVVTVPAGATSTTFPINTSPVGSDTSATITASYLGVSKSAVLTLLTPAFTGITVNPTPVKGGNSVSCTITIDRPAGAGGLLVQMSSSDPEVLRNFYPTVTIPQGQSSLTFTFDTETVSRTYAVSIIATIPSRNQQASTILTIIR